MRAFAEQMQVEIGQDRRKAIGVLHLDLVVAEARAQPVVRVARRDRAGEQAGVVDARQLADVPGLVEHLHRRWRPAGTRAPPARRPRGASRDS